MQSLCLFGSSIDQTSGTLHLHETTLYVNHRNRAEVTRFNK